VFDLFSCLCRFSFPEGLANGICALQAQVCVSSTARQASQFGYDVICVEDAIGDRSIPGVDAEQLVKTALSEIADAFGTVLQSSDIK
jgi:nicotinamidase-related amidase